MVIKFVFPSEYYSKCQPFPQIQCLKKKIVPTSMVKGKVKKYVSVSFTAKSPLETCQEPLLILYGPKNLFL